MKVLMPAIFFLQMKKLITYPLTLKAKEHYIFSVPTTGMEAPGILFLTGKIM